MTRDTRIPLILMGELVVALHANAPDAFKCWPYGGLLGLEGASGRGTAAGLALLVPDCGRAGQADGLDCGINLCVEREPHSRTIFHSGRWTQIDISNVLNISL